MDRNETAASNKEMLNDGTLDWRLTRASNREKLAYALERSLFADAEVVVGKKGGDQKVFKVHRLMLALKSKVFERLFFGDLKPEKPVKIDDSSPKIFSQFLEYIYTDDLGFAKSSSVADLIDLWYLSTKYMIDDLTSAIKTSLINPHCNTFDGALEVLEGGLIFDDLTIKKHALICAINLSETISQSQFFPHAMEQTVLLFLSQDYMNVAEINVWEAVCRWATARCSEEGLEVVSKNIRAKLSKIIECIRFRSVPLQTFSDVVVRSDILTQDETQAFLLCGSSQKEVECPKGLTMSVRQVVGVNASSPLKIT